MCIARTRARESEKNHHPPFFFFQKKIFIPHFPFPIKKNLLNPHLLPPSLLCQGQFERNLRRMAITRPRVFSLFKRGALVAVVLAGGLVPVVWLAGMVCCFVVFCWCGSRCCFVWGAVGLFVKSFFCRLRWPWLCFPSLSGPFVRLFADRLSWGFLLAFFVSGPVCLFLKSPFLWFRVRFRVRFSGFKKKGGRYFVPSSLVSGVVACGGPDKPGLRGAYRCA